MIIQIVHEGILGEKYLGSQCLLCHGHVGLNIVFRFMNKLGYEAELERIVIGKIFEAVGREEISETELGRRAFPEVQDSQKKVNDLKHGKRLLRFVDFYALCVALDIEPDRVLSSSLYELDNLMAKKRTPRSA